MHRKYGGIIWTDHALERLRQRDISQPIAWAVWRNPDNSRFAKTKGAWIFYKRYNNTNYQVVAKQNENKEWVVLTVWDRNLRQPLQSNKSFISNLIQLSSWLKSLLISILKRLF